MKFTNAITSGTVMLSTLMLLASSMDLNAMDDEYDFPSYSPRSSPGFLAKQTVSEEKRVANDGNAYTYGEFKNFYGDNADYRWNHAELASPSEPEQTPEPEPPLEEERRIANDGNAYTRAEFIKFYGEQGGASRWEAAKPASVPQQPEEKRLANDGTPYTRAEFIEHYGEQDGVYRWDHAKPAEQPKPEQPKPAAEEKRIANDGNAYTRAEFIQHYGEQGAYMWDQAKDQQDPSKPTGEPVSKEVANIDIQEIGRQIEKRTVFKMLAQAVAGPVFGTEWPTKAGLKYPKESDRELLKQAKGYKLERVVVWESPLLGPASEVIELAIRGVLKGLKAYDPKYNFPITHDITKDVMKKMHHMFLVCEFENDEGEEILVRIDMEKRGIDVQVVETTNMGADCTIYKVEKSPKPVTVAEFLKAANKEARPELQYNLFCRNCQHFARELFHYITDKTLAIPMDALTPIDKRVEDVFKDAKHEY